jgi:hypothetical protein
MRYNITNLTRGDVKACNDADLQTVKKALKRAADTGDRLHIRPIMAETAR